MFAKRFRFGKEMHAAISYIARNSLIYHTLSNDVIKLIYLYLPGKDGTLILKHDETLSLRSDIQYEFDNIRIPLSSHLKVRGWNSLNKNGGRLIINCFDTIQIDFGGSIDCSKCGYSGGKYALCCGESYDHLGQYNKNDGNHTISGYGAGGICGGGASYATKGNNGFLDKNTKKKYDNHADNNMEIGYAGKIYGDSDINELYLGSGGGSSFWGGGGNGGGALLIMTNNLINHGLITCSGSDATEHGSGGGSGGSIKINVLGEQKCIFGNIKAVGGNGKKLKGIGKSCGGKGGNGRICVNNKQLMLSDGNSALINNIKPVPYITWSSTANGNRYIL